MLDICGLRARALGAALLRALLSDPDAEVLPTLPHAGRVDELTFPEVLAQLLAAIEADSDSASPVVHQEHFKALAADEDVLKASELMGDVELSALSAALRCRLLASLCDAALCTVGVRTHMKRIGDEAEALRLQVFNAKRLAVKALALEKEEGKEAESPNDGGGPSVDKKNERKNEQAMTKAASKVDPFSLALSRRKRGRLHEAEFDVLDRFAHGGGRGGNSRIRRREEEGGRKAWRSEWKPPSELGGSGAVRWGALHTNEGTQLFAFARAGTETSLLACVRKDGSGVTVAASEHGEKILKHAIAARAKEGASSSGVASTATRRLESLRRAVLQCPKPKAPVKIIDDTDDEDAAVPLASQNALAPSAAALSTTPATDATDAIPAADGEAVVAAGADGEEGLAAEGTGAPAEEDEPVVPIAAGDQLAFWLADDEYSEDGMWVSAVVLARPAAAPAADSDSGVAALGVGSRVMADWKAKGTWYPGSVTKFEQDFPHGHYDILFDDGDTERCVPARRVRLEVEGDGDGTEQTWRVRYDDGDEADLGADDILDARYAYTRWGEVELARRMAELAGGLASDWTAADFEKNEWISRVNAADGAESLRELLLELEVAIAKEHKKEVKLDLGRWREACFKKSATMARLCLRLQELDDCLRWPSEDELVAKCIACGRGTHGPKLLLCDAAGCSNAYHTFCLQPQLDDIPRGKWECPQCTCKFEAPAPRPARVRPATKRYVEESETEEEEAPAAHPTRARRERVIDSEDEEEDGRRARTRSRK
mmetsp:Transcript_36143/g.84922  ORF Transcript_36143/g.84922 Transcript_36143/m.84922 type:complete len:773 (-) Transcript_36143:343-2661(-)